MGLLDFIGSLGSDDAAKTLVHHVSTSLDALPPDTARYVATFAFVLGRVAHADRNFSAAETRAMTDLVQVSANLTGAQAALVVEIAKGQHRIFGDQDASRLTKQFRKLIRTDELHQLMHGVLAVAAADHQLTETEVKIVQEIGRDLGMPKDELHDLLNAYHRQRV
jgi:uncharacterized tellurite resistance protein B-like protein